MKHVLIVTLLILVPATAWGQSGTRALQRQAVVIDDADFTFTTNVTVKNLHNDVEAAAMECEVRRTQPPEIIGQGRQPFTLDGTGSYSGNVVLAVRADAGKDPAAGNLYNCGLVLRQQGTEEWVHPDLQGETWRKPKPGEQFTSGSQGAIP